MADYHLKNPSPLPAALFVIANEAKSSVATVAILAPGFIWAFLAPEFIRAFTCLEAHLGVTPLSFPA